MVTRKLKNGGRKKALFGLGTEEAILAAAGINVAGSLTAAGLGAAATKSAAQDQAKATIENARRQAQAIKEQNEASKEMQESSQEFIKEQNEQNRDLQKDIQLQLQMLAGNQNVNDRLEASKIQVRNGGSTKRRLRTGGYPTSLLQGGDNMPFVITDGGNVIPIGTTPEGYDLYEIKGNDHEHYHKTRSGKNKTGVGIKFADGKVIEGEGNQNGNQGEYLLNTPDNAYFISRHSIAGFNPAKMVNAGMHPLQAYAIQENLKAANGISDDGKHNSSPVEKMMGGMPNNFYNMINANPSGFDTIGDIATGVAYATKNNRPTVKCGGHRKLSCGGVVRPKARNGYGWDWYSGTWTNNPNTSVSQKLITPPITNTNITGRINLPNLYNSGSSTTRGGGFNWNSTDTANLIGAGIGALGNIGGALITSGANRSAARSIANAQNQAAGMLANAYRSLTGIDMNSLRREDFAAAHAMPALQAPVSFAASRISGLNRQLQRRLANAGRYSASGASALQRMNDAEVTTQDMRNQVHSADQQQMQAIRQANAERVTQAAMKNAELDTAANRDYTDAYLDLLQYNNDINNQRILGSAGALSEGAINAANAIAQARTANATAWSNALTNSSQGFANTLSSMATRRADLAKVMLGASGDSQASYYANPELSSNNEARREYNNLNAQLNYLLASNKPEDADTIRIIKRRINTIAAGRGFDMV